MVWDNSSGSYFGWHRMLTEGAWKWDDARSDLAMENGPLLKDLGFFLSSFDEIMFEARQSFSPTYDLQYYEYFKTRKTIIV